MKVIRASLISEGTLPPALIGVVYLEDSNEFWNIRTTPSRAELSSAVTEGGVLALIEKDNKSFTDKLSTDEVNILLRDKEVLEMVRPWLRDEQLNNLGL